MTCPSGAKKVKDAQCCEKFTSLRCTVTRIWAALALLPGVEMMQKELFDGVEMMRGCAFGG
jgi:hypothetical protein